MRPPRNGHGCDVRHNDNIGQTSAERNGYLLTHRYCITKTYWNTKRMAKT